MSNDDRIRAGEAAQEGAAAASAPPGPRLTRVAVVQLAYHPAIRDQQSRSPLDDPLFEPEKPSSLLPRGTPAPPQELQQEFRALQEKVRATFTRQLLLRVEAALSACQAWGVEVVVFPEYSLPPDILPAVAEAAGSMIVIAGTHSVDRPALRSNVYAALGAKKAPELQQSVCPVLHDRRLIALLPKLNPAKPEQSFMKPGDFWRPVEMPPPLPGPMGVLICLDFLSRESAPYRALVGPQLDACRFLAVPSLTPTYTLPEFDAKAWEEARRYRRPVLYCNIAERGGSSIFVGEKMPSDHGAFPERPGTLEAGDEGVVVADIDLGYEPTGEFTRYTEPRIVVPFAAATFVYRARTAEDAYATWLDEIERLPDQELAALDAMTAHVRGSAAALAAVRQGARGRRIERLEAEIEDISSIERVRQLTREIVLPASALPLSALRSAMALGAADVVRSWLHRYGSEVHPFAEVEARLRRAGQEASPERAEGFTSAGRSALIEVTSAVRGDAPPVKERAATAMIVQAYAGVVEARFKDANAQAQRHFQEGDFKEARAIFRALMEEAERLADDPDNAKTMKQWAARCRLNVAACTLNLQEIEEGLRLLREVDASALSEEGRLALASAFAQTGDAARARALVPEREEGAPPEPSGSRLAEVRQLVAIAAGEIPHDLEPSSAVRLAAAELLFEREDLEGAGERALDALTAALEERHLLTAATALSLLIAALEASVFEEPPSVKPIPIASREKVVRAIEGALPAIDPAKLPDAIRRGVGARGDQYRSLTRDPEWPSARAPRGAEAPDPSEEARALASAVTRAEELARAGKLDEALRALPPVDHPWRDHLHRAQIMAVAGEYGRALAELGEWSEKAPIDYLRAELLLRAGRGEEAAARAEEAFRALPGRGYRFLRGRCLLAAGRAEDAWRGLTELADARTPEVLATFAQAAEVAEPRQAPRLWRLYLEKRPDDGAAEVRLAQTLFKLHEAEEAAKVAWAAFEKHRDRLDATLIYNCGLLQRLKGQPDERAKQRIKEAAALLRRRFPGDPQAEGLRFQLLRSIDFDAGEEEPIDYDLLTQSGFLEAVPAEEAIRRILLLQDRSRVIDEFYRSGALPFARSCALMEMPVARTITRILRGDSSAGARLCAPVSLADTTPLLKLESAELIITDVELYFLHHLGLLPQLKAALGASGRLLLTPEAQRRIEEELVSLGALANHVALERSAHLVELIEGRGELPRPIPVETDRAERARHERDRHAEDVSAARLANDVHEFVGQGLKEGWMQRLQGPRHPPRLPPLREPADGIDRNLLRDLIEEPLAEVLAVRGVMADHPTYFRVTADLFASNVLGHPGTFSRLDWTPREYLKLSGWNRTQAQRDIYLPALVRLLVPPALLGPKLFRLAELGFPDALGATELLYLLRTRSDQAATRVLDEMEWIARDPSHIGAEYARLRVVGVYAEAIWQAFCHREGRGAGDEPAQAPSPAEAKAIGSFLLHRLERMDAATESTSLERALSFIGLKTVERFNDFWVPSGEQRLTFSEEAPGAALWQFIVDWAGEDGHRRATYGRAVREVWRVLDELGPEGPPRARYKPLTLSFDIVRHPQGGDVSITEPELESVAILSAQWKERPLADMVLEVTNQEDGRSVRFDLETVLAHGASILGKSKDIRGNERTWRYPFSVDGLPELMTAYVPVEAVLLRAGTAERREVAKEWARVQGPHDGRLYELLRAMAERPDDASVQREYARHAAGALFRLVREEPGFLHLWPRRRGLAGGARVPRLEVLREILSEPRGPLPDNVSLENILIGRMDEDTKGEWSSRADARELFVRTSQMPGSLAAAPLGTRLAEPGYAREVELALDHIDDARDHPAARLAGDVIFLGVAAAEKPRVRLPRRGDIDLTDELPARLVRLLMGVQEDETTPQAERADAGEAIPHRQGVPRVTMASAEGALLRTCFGVVNRLGAHSEALPTRDRLWLTYRLFQWLVSQLEALAPDERQAGLAELVQKDPGVSDNVIDLLDPTHFAPGHFEHRLATVLHALAVTEEVIKGAQAQGRSAPPLRRAWSSELEKILTTIAELPCSGAERASVLAWHAVGHVPDLALVTLMRINPEGLLRLSPTARLRRIEALPREPEREEQARKDFTEALMMALSDHAGKLEDAERTVLEAKLRAMDESPTSQRYQWVGFTCLFGARAPHLEAEARSSLLAHAHEDPRASVMCGRFLMGVAALDPARLEAETKSLLAAAASLDISPDPGPEMIAAGLARVALHGSPAARVAARALLARLAKDPPLKDNPQMIELLRYLEIPEVAS